MKVGTDSYKGVRDFYPEDQFVQNYIFDTWKKTVSSFGYEEYNASILEDANLYRAKSGDEIVNEQTYTFQDRGDREVTLRPEMTPTIARMVAKRKRELVFPLRWFSIPNLFRYEQPQKGRTREHWQLNVDIFGLESVYAELEILEIASTLLRNFGLNDSQFEMRINDRRILQAYGEELGLNPIKIRELSQLLDKKAKISTTEFDQELEKIAGKKIDLDLQPNENITAIIENLKERGIANVVFDPTITRGFDYYTAFVFEVFDTSKENKRAIFGGGRYDDLLDIFGQEKVTGIGFGYGDVVMKDVLETYDLLPNYESSTHLALVPMNEAFFDIASEWATELRESGVSVLVDYSGKKVGDVIQKIDKRGIPYVAVIGEEEVDKKILKIKELESGEETETSLEEVKNILDKENA